MLSAYLCCRRRPLRPGSGDQAMRTDVQLGKTTLDCKYRIMRFPGPLSGDSVFAGIRTTAPTRARSSTNRAHRIADLFAAGRPRRNLRSILGGTQDRIVKTNVFHFE